MSQKSFWSANRGETKDFNFIKGIEMAFEKILMAFVSENTKCSCVCTCVCARMCEQVNCPFVEPMIVADK